MQLLTVKCAEVARMANHPLKMAVIGGGSPFVLCLLHGLLYHAARWRERGIALEIVLYDIRPESARRWVQYGAMLAQVEAMPLQVTVSGTREEALQNADVVMFTAGFPEAARIAHEMRERYGFPFHSIHDGPPGLAFAVKIFPFCLQLARDIARLSPHALLLVLPNPTDVLATALERATGVIAGGMCVEVEHLRDHLAFYFGYRSEDIALEHGGVNHDGWVLRMTVQGREGYGLLRDRLPNLPAHPHFHPGNYGMVLVYRATGYLRSSAYHNWPLEIPPCPAPRRWEDFGLSREEVFRQVEQTLTARTPLRLPEDTHPENLPVKYYGTGKALERLLWARATGETQVVALQVTNNGAISNFPNDVRVEVPVMVSGHQLTPQRIGEIPEWLGGTTRLLSIQRRLSAEYLLNGLLETLRQSLLTIPTFARIDALMEYAERVHELYKEAKEEEG